MQFLVFCAAVLRAVDRWQGLLRASIASAGNDHRLGANEAPPAILSIFLGEMLTDIFEQIEKGGGAKSTKQGGIQDLGVSVLPKLPRDAGDRNRTSPFAFTGNKFEFRAVSSGQSIAFPNMVLNAAMSDSLDSIANELEAATAKGEDLNKAVGKLLTKVVKEHKRIIFNGNNYAPEWEKEAGKRKLLNLKNTVDALPQLVTKEAIKLLDRFKILNERETHARYEIFLENYNKTINIEGQLMVLMANRYILPAAFDVPETDWSERCGGQGGRREERSGQEAARHLHEARGPVQSPDRHLGGVARTQRWIGREAREVHARQGCTRDGEAARDRRRD